MTYDLSGSCGWAIYSPGREAPRHGILKLPKPSTDGSSGAAFKLLYDHISWADRNFGLAHLGYEGFLAATGGRGDDKTTFQTSPKTTKRLVGLIAIVELCSAILGIPVHSIHNASWRRYWLGAQKRGTKRERFKQLAVEKSQRLGWAPMGDDDADALGQLHFLLNELHIQPEWNQSIERDLISLAIARMPRSSR